MKTWSLILFFALAIGILAGCGGQDTATSAENQANAAQALGATPEPGAYTSAVLVTGHEGALPAGNQLVLGTLKLEGTDQAVTPEQAQTLLPLWAMIQGGALQSDAETNAVLKQIEKAMTTGQLAAIAAMQLDMEDMATWMREQGIDLAPPAGRGTAGDGRFAPPDGMSEEEFAAVRATAQAGGDPSAGGFPGGGNPPEGGPFSNMSEEERASMRATAEAGGGPGAAGFPARDGQGLAGGGGQLSALAAPVIELLTARATE